MAGNSFGTKFRITTFGESHGDALGVVIDGVPSKLPLSPEDIQAELVRRRPGQSKFTTARAEADEAVILSGVFEGLTTGTPLTLAVFNRDVRSSDYSNIKDIFRPGHADYGYFKKYGIRDYRGGGRSSGRETLARVAAGAVAKKILAAQNIKIQAFTKTIGQVESTLIDYDFIEKNPLRCADVSVEPQMEQVILNATQQGDSVGGVVECHVFNLPAGWGDPVFDKLDALLAHAMLSIGGVKGIEFGDGFEAARRLGSENNDFMSPSGFLTNHAGGIAGGISNGNEVVFRVAVKPTPSISQLQKTVNLNNEVVDCLIKGRHDPCLCPRIVPVVEAMTAIVLADLAV